MADITALEYPPPVTKVLLVGTVALTFSPMFGILPLTWVYLSWPLVLHKLQLWRVLSAFFFAGGSLDALINPFLLYQTSSALEKEMYADTASYAWMVMVLAVIIHVLNVISTLHLPFLFRAFLLSLIYLWTKSNPHLKISLFGLVRVPARLYPVTLVVLDYVLGGPQAALGCLVGLISGHVWWFCATYLPTQAPVHLRRPNPLRMRPWFRRLAVTIAARTGGTAPTASSTSGRSTTVPAGFQVTRPRDDNPVAEMRHRWGSGQKLGSS